MFFVVLFLSHKTWEVTAIISTLLINKLSLWDLITSSIIKGQWSVNTLLFESQSHPVSTTSYLLSLASTCLLWKQLKKFQQAHWYSDATTYKLSFFLRREPHSKVSFECTVSPQMRTKCPEDISKWQFCGLS